jgi:hypothetical protein
MMRVRGGSNGVMESNYGSESSKYGSVKDTGDVLDGRTVFDIIYLHPLPTIRSISDVPDPNCGLVRSMFRRSEILLRMLRRRQLLSQPDCTS